MFGRGGGGRGGVGREGLQIIINKCLYEKLLVYKQSNWPLFQVVIII